MAGGKSFADVRYLAAVGVAGVPIRAITVALLAFTASGRIAALLIIGLSLEGETVKLCHAAPPSQVSTSHANVPPLGTTAASRRKSARKSAPVFVLGVDSNHRRGRCQRQVGIDRRLYHPLNGRPRHKIDKAHRRGAGGLQPRPAWVSVAARPRGRAGLPVLRKVTNCSMIASLYLTESPGRLRAGAA